MVLPLRDLLPGEQARIERIALEGPLAQRLREMGMTIGAPIECIGRSPLGDPAAYRLCGICLALRDRDTTHISVRR